MSDNEQEELLRVLSKMGDLQIYTAVKVTQLQAHVLTLQSIVHALQVNFGASPADLQKHIADANSQNDEMLRDRLMSWLTEHQIAGPEPDDPWWDRPQK